MNVRKTVFKALKKVTADGAYSNIALDAQLKNSPLDERDKRFAANLFYGVLENERLLDYIISKLVTNKGTKIEKDVRLILRMGIYQLKYMDKVPDNAAVNESVKLAKEIGMARVSGFINGMLRSFIRMNKTVELPDINKNKQLHLSLKYSCPIWLIELWLSAYSEEICVAVMESLSGRPPIYARVNNTVTNTDKAIKSIENDGAQAAAVSWIENAIAISASGSIEELEVYKNGEIHIQDLSSQLCCSMLDAKEGCTVLDVCAAPGGKSFTIAQILNNKGKVVSCDIHEHRVKLIQNGARRLKLDCVDARCRDALCGEKIEAECVLCDVPCSGLGIIRRKPDIKNKKPETIAELPQLQYDILCASAENVKKGGTLIYSTCTLNPEENEKVIERFLSENDEFEPYAMKLPQGMPRLLANEPEHMLTVFPSAADSDGFFIARIRRKD